jgi:two-component system alkaline phosphatase synthesis response regulator PhoP
LDILLPGIKGWEVCERIKADEKLRDIPGVMFTIRTSKEDMKHSMECCADAHINKPFEMKELLDTIEKLLGKDASS